MKFEKTIIDGLLVAKTQKLGDERGSFSRFFCMDEMKEQAGSCWQPVQINHSFTQQKASIRGLHFQSAPALEAKLVRCVKGVVFDVAVDLRKNSPSFLQHVAIELSAENRLAFLIPEGCAHGFQTLTDDCEMLYLHSAKYAKECEGGLRFDDPVLDIDWPLPAGVVSQRDESFAYIDGDFKGIADAL